MNNDDRKYLAYLTAWAVDRVVTVIYHSSSPQLGVCKDVCSYPELLDQAEILCQNFNPVAEETAEIESRLGSGSQKIAGGIAEYLFREPKNEMTAKELVRRIGSQAHEMKGGIDEDYNQGMKAMYNIFKKEAGL